MMTAESLLSKRPVLRNTATIFDRPALASNLLFSPFDSRFYQFVSPGSSYVYQYRNKVRDINATNLFLQMGLQNTHENTLLMLLEQIINEPCFNVLRTK